MLFLRFLQQIRETSHRPDTADTASVTPPVVHTRSGDTALLVTPAKSQWWKLLTLVAIAFVVAMGLMQILWLIARPLAILFAAIVIAQAMMPGVDRLERVMPRVVATLLLYTALVATLVGIGWLIFPPLIDQAQDVVDRGPELIEDGRELLNRWDPSGNGRLEQMVTDNLQGGAGVLAGVPFRIFSSLVELFLVFVMSIYWVIAAPGLRRFALSLFPLDRRENAASVMDEMGTAIGGYVRGTALDGVIVALVVYIGLSIIGVPYPLVLALLAGLGEFVPIVGPFIAGAPAVLFALLDSPWQAIIVTVFYVVIQQLESNVLLPLIMNSQAHVPPLLVLFAIFVGGSIAGILGALIAIPFAGATRVFVLRVLAPAIRSWTGAPSDGESVEETAT